MAVAVAQGFAYRSFYLPFVNSVHKVRQSSSVATIESLVESASVHREGFQLSTTNFVKGGNDDCKPHAWKKLNSKELGIRTSRITKQAQFVLNVLRGKGYEVYLVGGCVRDLVLKRTPKDFDILTSAELKEVMRAFSRCEIVGRRFPICHVHVDDIIVEVSSFRTIGRKSKSTFRRPSGCGECDFIRWKNCIQRDFTINGLMFDPFAKIVYDYIGGMEDIQRAKVRCVIPASTSFVEDCARILRGIRIAARLGFQFSRETSHFVKELSSSLLRLDKGRIHMEMNYMLAYGSAEASLRHHTLFRLDSADVIRDLICFCQMCHGFQHNYTDVLVGVGVTDSEYEALLVSMSVRKLYCPLGEVCGKMTEMGIIAFSYVTIYITGDAVLQSLFASLDKLLAPDRPCHSCLWVSILAFHEALVDQPRDALVIAAFSIAVHSGGSLSEAVDIASKISWPHDTSFHEILQPMDSYSKDALMDEVISFAASIKAALRRLTNERFVSQALIKYPQAPQSDMVFVSWALSVKVWSIFECVKRGKNRSFVGKEGSEIDYGSLALGRLHEVRRVFGRVVFDTVYPSKLARQ